MSAVYIDVHGHLAPYGETGGGPPSLRDPAGSLAAKRALGVRMTIIGSPVGAGSMVPGAAAGNYDQPADRVRAHNELMGELVDRFPAELRAYAYLDPFGDEAMLGQAAELVKDDRFAGLLINSSVRGEYLGSERAADFFAMADETGVPVLVHPPAEPSGTAGLHGHHGLIEHIARPCDVTIGIAAIVAGGWLERYPQLPLIAAAGGGGLALLAEKLELAVARTPGRAASGPRLAGRAVDSLAKVYVETSCPSEAQLSANLRVFGSGRVLFGSDSPPLLAQLDRVTGLVSALPAEDRDAVGWRNATALFGLPWPG
ncbi:amidohydrolase family protein [Amycolatopsis thailandensis]|uniref:amidohydrolase family protein n=1 Tax=Amycolatopsis thailandensis TaxID=589330 RepID=UPI00379DDF21